MKERTGTVQITQNSEEDAIDGGQEIHPKAAVFDRQCLWLMDGENALQITCRQKARCLSHCWHNDGQWEEGQRCLIACWHTESLE